MTLQLIICDQNEAVVEAWEKAFADYPEVEVRPGDLFDVPADALVSPANSYGFMDGGIDLAIRDYFGYGIQDAVQDAIRATGHPLPVGQALVVPTGDEELPYLIVAPTMETPSNVAHTINAYEAMWAVLSAVERFNQDHPGEIATVAVPGLCTGIGGMDPEDSARQMQQAYEEFSRGVGSGSGTRLHTPG